MTRVKFECPEGAFCFDGDVADQWLNSTAFRAYESKQVVFFDPTNMPYDKIDFCLFLAMRAVRPLSKPNRKLPPSIKGILFVPKEFKDKDFINEKFNFVSTTGGVCKFEYK